MRAGPPKRPPAQACRANVLVGGNNNTIGLQPISVGAQTGLNLALGVSALELRPAR